jgi:hypothetical protein
MFKSNAALSAVLALACSSCSFVFVQPPHHVEDQLAESPRHCTSSKAAPIVDTLITGLEAVRTGLAVSADDSAYQNSPIDRKTDIGLGVGLTALFLASSIYGFYETGQCHANVPRTHTPDDSEPAPAAAAPLDLHSTGARPSPAPTPRRTSPEEP